MIVMNLLWRGLTKDQYDRACDRVGWETKAPEGGIVHVAWFAKEGLRVLDVWETAEHFNRFVETRLMPVVKGELDIPGEPEVDIQPAHRLYQVGIGARS
ncbi:MAG: hypothetical protein U0166_15820 [Acidobacteriota bacterium]